MARRSNGPHHARLLRPQLHNQRQRDVPTGHQLLWRPLRKPRSHQRRPRRHEALRLQLAARMGQLAQRRRRAGSRRERASNGHRATALVGRRMRPPRTGRRCHAAPAHGLRTARPHGAAPGRRYAHRGPGRRPQLVPRSLQRARRALRVRQSDGRAHGGCARARPRGCRWWHPTGSTTPAARE